MKLRDIGYSLAREVGSDSAGSAFDHMATLGRVALGSFVRFGRGVPTGLFEQSQLRFSPRMTDIHGGKGRPVIIVPIGKVSFQTIETVSRVVTEVYGLPARILRSRAMWPQAYDPETQTANADKILRVLKPMMRSGRVLAITDVALKATMEGADKLPVYGPVYGYGGIGWPVAVVSTNSLGVNESDRSSEGRLVRVAVHELAHGFGVHHHSQNGVRCVMNMMESADGKLGLDRMTHELCTQCLGIVMVDKKKDAAPDKTETCL